jgi:DNA repair exonuclease SbcCD ATPase subunit
MRRDFSRWLRRRKTTIPPAVRVEHTRDGKRLDTYAIDEAIEQLSDLDASLRDGDEVIARNLEGEALEVFSVEGEGAGNGGGGRIGDRTLEAVARALGDANANAIPQLESVIERLHLEATRREERHQRELDRKDERIRAVETKLDETTEKLRAASTQALEHDRARWEREDRASAQKTDNERMDKCIDKALELAGELKDDFSKRHDFRVFFRQVLEQLDDETHAKIAAQLSGGQLAAIAELAEEPAKKKKHAGQVLAS